MERHNITVTWNDGSQTTTDINGTRMEICRYYEKATFTRGYNRGQGWREYKIKATNVHFND